MIVSGGKTSTQTAAGPATLVFKVAATGRKGRILSRRGVVTLRLTVALIPNGGDRNSRAMTISLKRTP